MKSAFRAFCHFAMHIKLIAALGALGKYGLFDNIAAFDANNSRHIAFECCWAAAIAARLH